MTQSSPELNPKELPPQPIDDTETPVADPLDPAQQSAAGGDAEELPAQGEGAADSY